MIEVAEYMIRILRLGKLRLVTRIAVCVCQLVVSVNMTLCALRSYVPACQWETRSCVIIGRRMPCGLRMTLRAVYAEAAGNMIGICGSIEIRPMTINASAWQICKLVVQMTLSACYGLMRSHERKACRIVAKC